MLPSWVAAFSGKDVCNVQVFEPLALLSLPPHISLTDVGAAEHSYSDELGKWMEVGNSGMFRPEMLRPMGLPEDVSVIAWGLSLERWVAKRLYASLIGGADCLCEHHVGSHSDCRMWIHEMHQ